jgi:hypothetical protein
MEYQHYNNSSPPPCHACQLVTPGHGFTATMPRLSTRYTRSRFESYKKRTQTRSQHEAQGVTNEKVEDTVKTQYARQGRTMVCESAGTDDKPPLPIHLSRKALQYLAILQTQPLHSRHATARARVHASQPTVVASCTCQACLQPHHFSLPFPPLPTLTSVTMVPRLLLAAGSTRH